MSHAPSTSRRKVLPQRSQLITRTEVVHQALRQAIIEQRLRPGMRLPEDAIGESFDASRTIAREALGRLAVEGLVELKPNRGAFVANPTLEEGREAFAVRRALERAVTIGLAGRLSESDVKRLYDHVEEERRNDRDAALAIRVTGEFHLLLAELTRNQLLLRYITEIVLRCSLVMTTYSRPHSGKCAASEHADIIRALVAGHAERAAALMDQHLDAVAHRALLHELPSFDIREILAPSGAKVRADHSERKRMNGRPSPKRTVR